MTSYPYVDIAVLDAVRRPFAAGDAMVIVSRDLMDVVWANGSGLELFGLGRLDAALSGEAALDDIQRRQIVGTVPNASDERMVHLRFVQGPQTVLLPVHVSVIALPDDVEAVLLRIPADALKSRTKMDDPLEAIRNAGSHAAFIKPGARLISGAEDLATLEIDPEDLARMMREVAGENDRLVKRQLRTARGDLPAALARLTDEDGLHLLVVIEPDQMEAVDEPTEISEQTRFEPVFEPSADTLAQPQTYSADADQENGDHALAGQLVDDGIFNEETAGAATPGPAPTISSFWVDEVDTETTPTGEIERDGGGPDAGQAMQSPVPVRFAWKTDADGRFIDLSDGFLAIAGQLPAKIIGQTFGALVKSIGIIDHSKVAELFEKRGTWSGRTVYWPVSDSASAVDAVMPVELAGLPVFGRDRVFAGFRGFGIARPEMAVARASIDIRPQSEDQSEGNVVPFGRRTTPPVTVPALPALDENEREAFAEIGARLRDNTFDGTESTVLPTLAADDKVAKEANNTVDLVEDDRAEDAVVETSFVEDGDFSNDPANEVLNNTLPNGMAPDQATPDLAQPQATASASPVSDNASIFGKLPLPVLVYSGEALHFANTAFLELSGYQSLTAIIEAGGLDALFGDGNESETATDDTATDDNTTGMHLTRADGTDVSVNAHLQSVPWADGKALMLAVAPRHGAAPEVDLAATQLAQADTAPEMAAAQQQIEELTAILDTATDGVVVLDPKGNIRSLNNAAQALFGYDEAEIAGQPLNALLAIESHRAANDYMAGLVENGVASVLNDGRDMIGREREGRFIPIFVNIARLSSSDGFCAVIRDVTNWKRAEEQLTSARRDAESASSNKTEFLASMSHEIRTPLNAIIGFSDLMMNERFGPLGNERYKDYLKDIHRSGNLVLSLINDLLDISKIEAGGQSFDFRAIDLNAVVEEAVGIMQAQANRERVLIRTSYGYDLPQLVADERSIKQIVLNLVSNAVRFTDAGGQVIVSTSYEQNGDLALKVRDNGIGMNESELEDALRPYRQVGQKADGENSGTGLGLPLARALAESNKGDFRIRSTPGEGTVIEIAFPASRVLAG